MDPFADLFDSAPVTPFFGFIEHPEMIQLRNYISSKQGFMPNQNRAAILDFIQRNKQNSLSECYKDQYFVKLMDQDYREQIKYQITFLDLIERNRGKSLQQWYEDPVYLEFKRRHTIQ
jgi:hypothetical protein